MNQSTQVKVTPKTPRAANFIFTEEGEKLPVSRFSDAALRRIGESYGDALIENKARQLGREE